MEGWYVKRWSHSSEAHSTIYDSILKPKYLEHFPQDRKTAFMFINMGTKGKGQFCQSASVATKLCWLSGICGALPTSFAEGFFFKQILRKNVKPDFSKQIGVWMLEHAILKPFLHSESCFWTRQLRRRCKNMKPKGRLMTAAHWRNSCKNLVKISFVTLPLWQIVTTNSKFRLSGCKSAIESSLKNFLCNSRKNMWRKTLNPPQMWFHTNIK